MKVDNARTTRRETTAVLPEAIAHRRWALVYGAVCHLTFVCAISTQFYMMYGGMTQSQGTATGTLRWVLNIALVLQFPLVHSFLLTRRGQRVLAALAPPGLGKTLWSTTFVTIAAAQILLMFMMWSPSGTVWWSASGATRWLLTGLYVASWLLLFKAMKDAGWPTTAVSLDGRPFIGMSARNTLACRQPGSSPTVASPFMWPLP